MDIICGKKFRASFPNGKPSYCAICTHQPNNPPAEAYRIEVIQSDNTICMPVGTAFDVEARWFNNSTRKIKYFD